MAPVLKTAIWAAALVRRAEVAGASAFIVRKGDPDAGVVLVKVATLNGYARLFAPAQNAAGERIWMDLSGDPLGQNEPSIDAQIARTAQRDPDLWVIEIEDRAGRSFLTEPIDQG